jgi:hypothetical protein
MNPENGSFDRTQFLIEEWKTVIETQIHFNEMIIRARTTGVSSSGVRLGILQFGVIHKKVGLFLLVERIATSRFQILDSRLVISPLL